MDPLHAFASMLNFQPCDKSKACSPLHVEFYLQIVSELVFSTVFSDKYIPNIFDDPQVDSFLLRPIWKVTWWKDLSF